MIKSVTLKDPRNGEILFKVIWRKTGVDMIRASHLTGIDIDVRDEKNQKIIFGDSK